MMERQNIVGNIDKSGNSNIFNKAMLKENDKKITELKGIACEEKGLGVGRCGTGVASSC